MVSCSIWMEAAGLLARPCLLQGAGGLGHPAWPAESPAAPGCGDGGAQLVREGCPGAVPESRCLLGEISGPVGHTRFVTDHSVFQSHILTE